MTRQANGESGSSPHSSPTLDSTLTPRRSSAFRIHHSLIFVTGVYLLVTVGMTWPLARGLARDVPADLGDPLLNMWILDWMATGVLRVAGGSMELADLWNANIFHPEPLALAFSEHLFGQTLQLLPVYLASGNLVLSYNLLFVSTFVLAGVGMYVLALDLTGRRDAAFVAGLMFAFTPLRVTQLSHIQILGTQWMPLALYGFRRYIADGRWRALLGGTGALLMLAWSCGYYLVYFSPFVPLFIAHQMYTRGRLKDWRMWLALAGAGVLVMLGTYPFLVLYADAQRVHGFERSLGEVIRFSADLGGYLTASEMMRVWGPVLRLAPKPEGEVFPGFVALVLASIAIVVEMAAARGASRTAPPASGWTRVAIILLGLLGAVQLAGLLIVIATGGFVASAGGFTVRATGAGRILGSLVVAVAGLLLLSGRTRRAVVALAGSWVALAVMMTVLAMWLSLGPRPSSFGQALSGLGLYRTLFDHVPGFDGLRVPARYAMVATCFLVMVAAAGCAALMRREARSRFVAVALSGLVLVEGCAVPIPVNATWGDGAAVPPPRVHPSWEAPAVYRTLAALPSGRVIAEFPFGDPAWELRYVFYATVHHQRLVNGYSGGFPRGYLMRVAALQRIAEDPGRAWRTLADASVTHAVLHRGATTPAEADSVAFWLSSHGARVISAFDEDVLYELPAR